MLAQLDARYPDTKHVLYPMALCLERLGRGSEALPLCNRLVGQFQDPRAEALRARITAPPLLGANPVEVLLGYGDLAEACVLPDLGAMQSAPPPLVLEEEPSRWPAAVLAAVVLLVLVGLVAARLVLGGGGDVEPAVSSNRYTAAAFLAGVIIGFFMYQIVGTAAAVFALGTLKKLPENTIGGNIIHVGATLLVINVGSTILGLLLSQSDSAALGLAAIVLQNTALILLFNHHYQLGCGGMAVFGLMFFIFMCVGFALPFMLLLSALGIVAFFAL